MEFRTETYIPVFPGGIACQILCQLTGLFPARRELFEDEMTSIHHGSNIITARRRVSMSIGAFYQTYLWGSIALTLRCSGSSFFRPSASHCSICQRRDNNIRFFDRKVTSAECPTTMRLCHSTSPRTEMLQPEGEDFGLSHVSLTCTQCIEMNSRCSL